MVRDSVAVITVPDSTVEAFRRASGDASPLHGDAQYARRTAFGEPVVHGVLAAFVALGGLPARDGRRLARIEARFPAPLLPGQPYRREVVEDTVDGAVVRLTDGERLLAEVVAAFAAGESPEGDIASGEPGRTEAAALDIDDLAAGKVIGVGYGSRIAEMTRVLDLTGAPRAGLGLDRAAVLGWVSYLVGMEAPGRAALLSRFTVDFAPNAWHGGFTGEAEIAEVDSRFRRVRLTGSATVGAVRATVEAEAFVRSPVTPPDPGYLTALLPSGAPLDGRVAFVVGGSRGLGAACVQALALAGCTVYAGFRHGTPDADAVRSLLGGPGDRVHPLRLDAADPGQCAAARDRILAEQGRLDILVLSASPPLQSLGLDAAAASRAVDYVARSLALVQAPLASCLSTVQQILLISSEAVTRTPVGWAHYATAKHAAEGLLRAAAGEHPGVRCLVARPPRLRTTFADAPATAAEAMPVEPVAAALVGRLAETPATDGEVMEVVEDFEHVSHPKGQDGAVVVVGTFTTDPLRETLGHWIDRLGLGLDVVLAPYGQVFQELLDPESAFSRNRTGVNVVLLRWEDWPSGPDATRTLDEFVAAVEAYARRTAVPLLVCLCPPSPMASARKGRVVEMRALEERLAGALAAVPGVLLMDGDRWHGGFPVADHHDAARHELAHLPYTPLAYTALGTGLARAVHGLLGHPFKVLVLDCDNVLWQGVCGEDGPQGVQVGPAYRYLQQWAVDRQRAGVLLCLCSKNAAEDVSAVFAHHTDAPLRPEHIAAQRIGWDAKPDSIRALAAELDLGLDSFVFLDDNPAEVAAVRAAHPEVLTLAVPTDPADIPDFLDRIWVFDRWSVTEEDRRRTAFYHGRRERAELRRHAATFADFIRGLDLRVRVYPVREDQLARVAQLTQRTNQFNLSTRRRTEAELRDMLANGMACRVVEAADRFGDHGVVGVALTGPAGDETELDTFLLSCRVLGRGVEHAAFAEVCRAIVDAGGHTVRATFVPTAKNAPVRRFLDSVAGTYAEPGPDGTVVYRAPAAEMAGVAFHPEEAAEESTVDTVEVRNTAGTGPFDAARLATLAAIAEELTDAAAVHNQIHSGYAEPPAPAAVVAEPESSPLDAVRSVFSRILAVSAEDLFASTTVESLRLSSLDIVDATVALEKRFGPLPKTLLFEQRTLGDLAAALPGQQVAAAPSGQRREEPADTVDGIAVVGVAGRYPGARSPAEMWENLRAGRDSVTEIPPERWDHSRYLDPDGGAGKTYSAWAGLLDGVDEFDPLFFGIAPREAETMDPQQRLFLQIAYAALEDAGHTRASLGPAVGVYVGAMSSDYGILSAEAALSGHSQYPYADNYQIANRVSHFFDFTGPSVVLDTACSASAVALQLACDALRQGTVSAALVGGVNVILHPSRHIQYAQIGMLSRTGRCRSFADGADGIVTGEGVGAILLRPLRDALADGDHVYGVIRGVATNSDGRTNGFTVPNPDAQAALVARALEDAGVDPATVSYVEAHGSGTALGDPIEIRGLTRAFSRGTGEAGGRCAIGSVKSNVGHLVAAAAVAGLTKVLFQFRHGTLVPSLHAERLNEYIDFDATPFRVQRELAAWPRPRRIEQGREVEVPRRAGLSSFGAGGVNVHVVLEEPPAVGGDPVDDGGPELIVLSAQDDERLRAVVVQLHHHLAAETSPAVAVADLAYTLRAGRMEMDSRLAFVASDRAHLVATLGRLATGAWPVDGVTHGRREPGREPVGDIRADSGLTAVAQWWVRGGTVAWDEAVPRGRRVPLPTYPFRRERYWLPTPAPADPPAVPCYRAVWRPVATATSGGRPADTELLVLDTPADAENLMTTLDGRGALAVVDRTAMDAEGTGDPARLLALPAALGRAAAEGRCGPVTYIAVTPPAARHPAGTAIVAFGRSAAEEAPNLRCRRIEVAADTRPALPAILAAAFGDEDEVRIDDGQAFVRRFERLDLAPAGGPHLRDRGTYLISGGAGGIGRLLARHLATRYRANLVLIGRSAAGAEVERLLGELRATGGDASYIRADVTRAEDVTAAVAAARTRYGRLHGVIHAAGVVEDAPLRDKSAPSVARVLAPKTTGTVLLDRATAGDELDFFLLMSSVVGTLGNAGQADYAAASRFLDAFAEYRDAQAAAGHRHGRSLALAWPLWTDGGMSMPAERQRLLATTTGLEPLETDRALDTLEAALAAREPAILVGHGDTAKLDRALNRGVEGRSPAGPSTPVPLAEPLRQHLRAEVAALAKLSPDRIAEDVELGAYGFHSVLFTELANRLNATLGTTLTPVMFFRHPTITAIAGELLARHPDAVSARLAPAPVPPPAPVDRIAIVGAYGRFPGAPDLDAFWANLVAGRSTVAEVPPERWDWRAAAGDSGRGGGRYGAFLDDVDAFDAAFFQISPREAHLMDPQQRLFLEACWSAIEDAGYDPRALAGSRTAVFAGVSLFDYLELLVRNGRSDAGHLVTGTMHSIVANRVSYLLDLRGASEVVDTACSSSLVALHRAVAALRAGECDAALVGGVNALMTPALSASLDGAGMLSPTGGCHTFDDRADGYARGEGVGVVLLKPLSRAVADGDTVRAVILGSAVNHGGHAHSLTAPNPRAQADVVVAAYTDAGITPDTVTYVEAHGTGTRLGDPIEVSGLREAFARLGATAPPGSCALGAVKTAIGHLEPAAGVAGLLKVLLAMRHQTLPPNAGTDRLNPNLDLAGGPFHPLVAATPWRPLDRDGNAAPRRAGISSFGFGGTNAHILVEEPPPAAGPADDGRPQVVVLSAADRDALRRYALRLRAFLDRPDLPALVDIGYTSRTGRPALAARLAVVATNHDELRQALGGFLAGRPAPVADSDVDVLVARWMAGETVDWSALPVPHGRRVPLPTYPFDRTSRHGLLGAANHTAKDAATASDHHPVLRERHWVTAAPGSGGNPAPPSPCLLILGRAAGVPLLGNLSGPDGMRWIVIREHCDLPRLVPDEYEVDFDDYDAGRELAASVLAQHPDLGGVIDLADLHRSEALGGEAARVALLQALAERRAPTRIVHMTSGRALAGSRMAGLVRSLGAEYAALRTTSVDTDLDPADVGQVLATAVRELAVAGDEPEVSHRQGERFVPRLRDVDAGTGGEQGRLGGIPVHPDRTYLVTGGTGGLGLATAGLLVERGARRLALFGRRPLPPRAEWDRDASRRPTVDAIRRMEDAGATVALYHGPLTDRDAVNRFLTDVRRRLGPIAGLLHCAGAAPATPGFARKPWSEITGVWEPKAEGLLALHDLLRDDDLDGVVLYSSLSAAVPALAAGMVDYAAANAFLDAFAAHHGSAGGRTRYLAVQWGSWAGIGMGEVRSRRYAEAGFAALTREQGLGLLDRALSTATGPTLVAAAASPRPAAASPRPAAVTDEARVVEPVAALVDHLTGLLAPELMLDRGQIRADTPFAELGVDSILIAGIVRKLEAVAGEPLDPSLILEYPSVSALAGHLAQRYRDGVGRWLTPPAAAVLPASTQWTPLAVVGMAARFPGASTVDEYWELLRSGRSGIREVPPSRWDTATRYAPTPQQGHSISRWGGFLDGIEDFDPEFFGIRPEDAAHMDPLIRLFLESTEQVFRDAGYGREELAGRRVGVYVGSGTGTYGTRIPVPGRATATGLNQNFIAAQLAHVYDLRGPNLVVDTACSSSLVSLYLAQQALHLGECEMAVVGGADLLLDEMPYLRLSAAQALSPDGTCHVFDVRANGFVPGEGVGSLLVKPLARALADGDRIHAVVESCAVNNDGRTMGLTTPNPDAQRDVVLDALARAGADARSISYVEAHGTGTMIGDPIELKALTAAFRRHTDDRGFCAVGSVKSNVGHLLMAAGMAALEKVVLSLAHRELPPTLHCTEPNPRFAFDSSPFYPNLALRDWQAEQGPRRAGVSAFGFGGTNCHAILRELTEAERADHRPHREPLAPAAYRRRRFWVDPPPVAGNGHRPNGHLPNASGRLSRPRLLELEEL